MTSFFKKAARVATPVETPSPVIEKSDIKKKIMNSEAPQKKLDLNQAFDTKVSNVTNLKNGQSEVDGNKPVLRSVKNGELEALYEDILAKNGTLGGGKEDIPKKSALEEPIRAKDNKLVVEKVDDALNSFEENLRQELNGLTLVEPKLTKAEETVIEKTKPETFEVLQKVSATVLETGKTSLLSTIHSAAKNLTANFQEGISELKTELFDSPKVDKKVVVSETVLVGSETVLGTKTENLDISKVTEKVVEADKVVEEKKIVLSTKSDKLDSSKVTEKVLEPEKVVEEKKILLGTKTEKLDIPKVTEKIVEPEKVVEEKKILLGTKTDNLDSSKVTEKVVEPEKVVEEKKIVLDTKTDKLDSSKVTEKVVEPEKVVEEKKIVLDTKTERLDETEKVTRERKVILATNTQFQLDSVKVVPEIVKKTTSDVPQISVKFIEKEFVPKTDNKELIDNILNLERESDRNQENSETFRKQPESDETGEVKVSKPEILQNLELVNPTTQPENSSSRKDAPQRELFKKVEDYVAPIDDKIKTKSNKITSAIPVKQETYTKKTEETEFLFEAELRILSPVSKLSFQNEISELDIRVPVFRFTVPSMDGLRSKLQKVDISVRGSEDRDYGFSLIMVDGQKEDVTEVAKNSVLELLPGRYTVVPRTNYTTKAQKLTLRVSIKQ